MPSLKLSNPFRRGVERPSLKERAAALKATAGRVMRRPKPLPAATLSPDPIFAAIKAHWAARHAFKQTVNPADEMWVAARGGDVSPEGMAPAQEAYRRADAAETRAWNDLFLVRPTTQAGLVALLFHAREFVSEQDGDDLISLRDIFTAIAASVRAVPSAAAVPAAGRGAAVSPAIADLIARHRVGLAHVEAILDTADDDTLQAVDIAAWDLAHEAFKLPIAGPADLSAKLELAAPEIDAALDAAGHSMASHAWNCMRADLLGGAIRLAPLEAPDPVHGVIADSRRLLALNEGAPDGPPGSPEDAASSAAFQALFEHWKDVVLKARPTTAVGCSDLVRYVVEFADAHEFSEDELVAAVRLLADGLAMARA